MFKCKYCNKTYLKSFTLKTHQNKSKKCLKNQENYNNKLKIEFEKLPAFTAKSVKESLLKHVTIKSILSGEEDVYSTDFVNGIKNFIIVIDEEKQEVIIKDEDGNARKTTSKEIVSLCFILIKKEQDKLIEQIERYLETEKIN